MTYIDRIRQNVVDAIDIKKFARKKRTKYSFAKLYAMLAETMYQRNTIVEALNTAARFQLPLSLVNEIDLPSLANKSSNVNMDNIYYAIGKYANKEVVKSLEGVDAYVTKKYGEMIFIRYIEQGIPLDRAIKAFDKSVARKMKRKKISEFAVTTGDLFFGGDYETAKRFEKDYLDGNIKADNSPTIVSDLLALYYVSEVYNGITLVSKTEEGLKKLKDYVQSAYKTGKPEVLEFLSKAAEKTKLKIIDFQTLYISSCFENDYNYIYIKPNDLKKPSNEVFFHEATHFLDWALGRERDSFVSNDKPEFGDVLKKIEDEKKVYSRGKSISWLYKKNERRYVHNSALNRNWLAQIKMKNPNSKGKVIREFLTQKRLQERKKYGILSSTLQDIYDAISEGELHSKFGTAGHGIDYYANPDYIPVEFIANVGAFYNCGGEDILIHEFGVKLAKEMLELYRAHFTAESTMQIKSA